MDQVPASSQPAALPIGCEDPIVQQRDRWGFGDQLCWKLLNLLRCLWPRAVPVLHHPASSHPTLGPAPQGPCGPRPSQGMLPGMWDQCRGKLKQQHSSFILNADKSFSHQRKLWRGTKELNLFKTQPGVQTSLSYCNS